MVEAERGLGAVEAKRRLVEAALDEILPREDPRDPASPVAAAMRYAVLSGGKRIRPAVAHLVGDLFGAPLERVSGLACCVELLHTASLVLDDLPSMDDALLRRGRPTLHRATDEATAILAAEALLVLAFDAVVSRSKGASPELLLRLVGDAARTVGAKGMTGGQHTDLHALRAAASGELVESVHQRKTARLFELASSGAALLAGARPEEAAALARYGRALGMAFQVGDDLLDATRSSAATGKDAGKDAGKATFASVYGVDRARSILGELAGEARRSIASFGERGTALAELADFVERRCGPP